MAASVCSDMTGRKKEGLKKKAAVWRICQAAVTSEEWKREKRLSFGVTHSKHTMPRRTCTKWCPNVHTLKPTHEHAHTNTHTKFLYYFSKWISFQAICIHAGVCLKTVSVSQWQSRCFCLELQELFSQIAFCQAEQEVLLVIPISKLKRLKKKKKKPLMINWCIVDMFQWKIDIYNQNNQFLYLLRVLFFWVNF